MTRFISILALILTSAALPGALPAAVSPLAAGSDYVFSKPAVTNAIKGFVMGDTGDYGVMRYEDAAFLLEAFAERDYLTRSSVSSNDFMAVATNRATVLKTPQISELRLTPYLERFLDPACKLSTSPRIVYTSSTNVYASASWSASTNFYPAATHYITQVMTNGALNVYTNVTSGFTSNILVSAYTTTNLFYNADYCLESNTVTLANTTPVTYATLTTIRALHGPYSRRAMTNLYALVRAMRRKVPTAGGSTLAVQNNALEIAVSSTGYTSTNLTTTSSYSAYISKTRNAEDRQNKSGDTWVSEYGYPYDDTSRVKTFDLPQTLSFTISPALSEVLISHASHVRVNRADAFILAQCHYRRDIDSYHTVQGGTVTDLDVETNLYGSVMIPVGSAVRESGHDDLTLTLTVTTSIYETAADTLGYPFVTTTYDPDLPQVATPAWDYDDPDTPTAREKKSHQSAVESLDVSLTVYIILHLNPKTTLNTWSEYD